MPTIAVCFLEHSHTILTIASLRARHCENRSLKSAGFLFSQLHLKRGGRQLPSDQLPQALMSSLSQPSAASGYLSRTRADQVKFKSPPTYRRTDREIDADLSVSHGPLFYGDLILDQC